MSDQAAFGRMLESLYEAMLDNRTTDRGRWPRWY